MVSGVRDAKISKSTSIYKSLYMLSHWYPVFWVKWETNAELYHEKQQWLGGVGYGILVRTSRRVFSLYSFLLFPILANRTWLWARKLRIKGDFITALFFSPSAGNYWWGHVYRNLIYPRLNNHEISIMTRCKLPEKYFKGSFVFYLKLFQMLIMNFWFLSLLPRFES